MNIYWLLPELAILYILYYKLVYTLYVKKFLRMNQYRPIYPFDCFQCSALWTGLIASIWHCTTWEQHIQYTLIAYVVGILIEGATEKS